MNFIYFFILFGIFINLLTKIHAGNVIKITDIQCWGKPEVIHNLSCSVKNFGDSQAIDADGWALISLKNIYGSLEVNRKISGSYKPFLLNVTVNVCKLLEGNSQSFYGTYVMKWIRDNSKTNALHSCPFEGYTYAKDLVPTANNLPIIAPSGDYRVDLYFYAGQRSEDNLFFKFKGFGSLITG